MTRKFKVKAKDGDFTVEINAKLTIKNVSRQAMSNTIENLQNGIHAALRDKGYSAKSIRIY